MRLPHTEIVEYRECVECTYFRAIGIGIMRLVALTSAAGIEQNHLIVLLQRLDVPPVIPALQAVVIAVVQHERRAFAFHLVMNANSLVVAGMASSLSRVSTHTTLRATYARTFNIGALLQNWITAAACSG
jgi:hypothetical protein